MSGTFRKPEFGDEIEQEETEGTEFESSTPSKGRRQSDLKDLPGDQGNPLILCFLCALLFNSFPIRGGRLCIRNWPTSDSVQ